MTDIDSNRAETKCIAISYRAGLSALLNFLFTSLAISPVHTSSVGKWELSNIYDKMRACDKARGTGWNILLTLLCKVYSSMFDNGSVYFAECGLRNAEFRSRIFCRKF